MYKFLGVFSLNVDRNFSRLWHFLLVDSMFLKHNPDSTPAVLSVSARLHQCHENATHISGD